MEAMSKKSGAEMAARLQLSRADLAPTHSVRATASESTNDMYEENMYSPAVATGAYVQRV